ncbi:pseudouridine synthase [Sphingobacterium corticibacterium]|uniref:Pseudouridine synthase n=1 Tax=Sphingobacterium corticibacterium TaxID=2484746 RepID=A0A4Q6XUG1_9SPHI|nr:pseudouridine synthase [Sphingobacterium corticibacterium]RZF61272.1 rRNA pseudouridine synthase [Sphingobacterium corticibacterium]
MPFNNKRNSRDDNSKKSRSNSENFRSKNGRSTRSSSTNEFRKSRFEEEDSKKSNPFSKFEKKNKKDDSNRSFNKFDKLKKNTDRPFSKDEKGNYRGSNKFDKSGKKSFDRFDGENKTKDKYKNKDTYTPSYPRKKIASAEPKDDGLIRLNRYISNAGVCSRRKADELIESGVVSVNGEVVTELGTKVDPAKDEIKYNGERLKREKMVYVLLNKPKDFITTTDDPQERRTVMQLVAKATKERIYPVGRLDRNTTGLLLLTNDGALAEKLSHPRNNISKIYHVELDKNLTQGDFNKIQFGIELEDGVIKPDDISYVQGGSRNEIGIQIHSGKNRVVRRIFESLGYEVIKLDRVVYANLTKKDLPRGRWRYLEEKELIQLKHFIK